MAFSEGSGVGSGDGVHVLQKERPINGLNSSSIRFP
jgi:hypothetical protein